MAEVVVVTPDRLEEIIVNVLHRCGVIKDVPVQEHTQTELPTRLAKEYLKDRGHRVNSYPAFRAILAEHGIVARNRGKENWYQVADLDKIPKR